MHVPTATYRLQLDARFDLRAAAAIVDYLAELGVGDVYLSPILTAPRGAAHGYHVTDPTRINPELGGDEGMATLAAALTDRGCGSLLDIVPNHLAASTENPWWVDVLTHGPASAQGSSFDIDWEASDGRVVLPILGRPLDEAIDAGDITLALDDDGLHLDVPGDRLPLDPATCAEVFRPTLARLRVTLGDHHPAVRELARLVGIAEHVPPRHASSDHERHRRHELADELTQRLRQLDAHSPPLHRVFTDAVREVRDERLRDLLERQPYELAFWRTGVERLNYRRFFDITDLVGVRVEDPQVFAERHERIFQLIADGAVTGLRVDHVDGLLDPGGYLTTLERQGRSAATGGAHGRSGDGPDATGAGEGSGGGHPDRFYVVVEKILEGDEPLPQEWPVAGTTGYEFLNAVNAVLVDGEGLARIEEIYRDVTGRRTAVADTRYRCKVDVLQELFRGEVEGLTRRLVDLAGRIPEVAGVAVEALRETLIALTAAFPVYRTYLSDGHLPARDRARLEHATGEVRRRRPDLDGRELVFLERVAALDVPVGIDEDVRRDWREVVLRWQQLTGPAMAKGFEDTTFYVENRLISLNEVGVDPDGIERPAGVSGFHQRVTDRARTWPHAMTATSTHDTKRSEDVRARLAVLTEIPDEWAAAVTRWTASNAHHRRDVDGRTAPDRNEEWLLYQALIGMWPLHRDDETDVQARVRQFAQKAAREAKVNTSWLDPDERYEGTLLGFVDRVLADEEFVADVRRFVGRVALPGAVNSLSQVLLKLVAPGVPDTYQGTELWDWSLVDPDNRRPVDYVHRRRLLDGVRSAVAADPVAAADDAREGWRDGRVKLLVVWRALQQRQARPALLRDGTYEPVVASGVHRDRVVAFLRRDAQEWIAAIAPRCAAAIGAGGWPVRGTWGDTVVQLPGTAGARELLTGRVLTLDDGRLRLADAFAHLPVALISPT
ncbi:MAG: malto-oligosyltrehalose synthase [Actinobacteria bacterium]|nr:malto-oligosyltrehalose synthase [Actinomycetota bacterium]